MSFWQFFGRAATVIGLLTVAIVVVLLILHSNTGQPVFSGDQSAKDKATSTQNDLLAPFRAAAPEGMKYDHADLDPDARDCVERQHKHLLPDRSRPVYQDGHFVGYKITCK